jgi:TRAP-type C4-dicarboxylate transport system substrate-binding protein
MLFAGVEGAQAQEPVRLKVIGGHGGVSMFAQHEEPFWTRTVTELSGGRIKASIHPFDRSGLRGQDMLQLMRLGVVPFGTVLLAVASGEEPELNAVDLPVLSPDIETLRTTVRAYRPHLARILRERHDIELLGVYTYPAQVIYCAKAFGGLDDLKGRRVRTSSVGQSELVEALGGMPVITPFTETVNAVSTGVVDCAITGTLSGYEVGLSEVTSHVHAMAISWGISFFAASRAAWEALAPDLRETVRGGVAGLEDRIWAAAGDDTARGFACNTGTEPCAAGRRGRMSLVPVTPADDERRRRLLVDTVLPGWIERCGTACAAAWNGTLGPALGIRVGAP